MQSNNVEFVSCPYCRSTEARPWGTENGYTALRCAECAIVYVSPRPSETQIHEATRLGLHDGPVQLLDVTTRRQPQKIRHYRSVLEKLYADVSMQDAPHSWLDVGAGYGEFLEAVQARFPACNAMGIEPMEAKCAAAQARGLDVSSTSLEQLTSKFDVVSMINVFSHIPRFDAFLDEIKAKLNEGGEIFLETGNGGDLERRSQYPDPLYLPDHLVFAGETHIAGFLERAGFEVISIARLRTDTLVRCLKNVLKRAAGKGAVGAWPYTSPFRTVMFRARLPAQP